MSNAEMHLRERKLHAIAGWLKKKHPAAGKRFLECRLLKHLEEPGRYDYDLEAVINTICHS